MKPPSYTPPTKAERQQALEQRRARHHQALASLHANPAAANGLQMWRALRRLEKTISDAATAQCNAARYGSQPYRTQPVDTPDSNTMSTTAPTYQPQSKAEATRLAEWLRASKIDFSATLNKSHLTDFHIGVTRTKGMEPHGTSLETYQAAKQMREALAAIYPLIRPHQQARAALLAAGWTYEKDANG